MFLELALAPFLGEHVREQFIVDSHLEGVVGLEYVEEAAVDDEGVIVFGATERGLVDVVEYLAVNGQFRFSREERIVEEEAVPPLSDAH
jgi:hypothetical protein